MKLRRDLGMLEALALSLSIIAPTMSMSFGTSLAVQAAGVAAPLSFLIGMLAMVIVGLSFVAFERRIASSGSVYAYIGYTFGQRAGFLAGWALLLTYLTFTAGATALIGNFLMTFLAELGFRFRHSWLPLSLAGILVALWMACRDTRVAARLMLTLEGISVVAILFITFRILTKVPLSTVPLRPDSFHHWAGVGYGTIYAILSFAGFEGATTLGEETKNPKQAIPVAIMGTVIISGILFALVSYAEVLGYGLDHVRALGQAESPLGQLSNRFVSHQFAMFIDLATAISAFACTIGSLSAAARTLYVLGRSGAAPGLGVLHHKQGTPARALLIVGAGSVIPLLVFGTQAGPISYSCNLVTIGTLSLILVYIVVAGTDLIEALRNRRIFSSVVGFTGAALLLWPLWNSFYPVPRWPGNLWPYVVMTWVVLGGLQVFLLRRKIIYESLD